VGPDRIDRLCRNSCPNTAGGYPLYITRWRIGKRAGLRYLRVVEGLKDAVVRRRVAQTSDDWRNEALWMSLYFSVGVWVSLGIIFV